eukprot:5740531-Pleurochrysis_carterae.AAC.1
MDFDIRETGDLCVGRAAASSVGKTTFKLNVTYGNVRNACSLEWHSEGERDVYTGKEEVCGAPLREVRAMGVGLRPVQLLAGGRRRQLVSARSQRRLALRHARWHTRMHARTHTSTLARELTRTHACANAKDCTQACMRIQTHMSTRKRAHAYIHKTTRIHAIILPCLRILLRMHPRTKQHQQRRPRERGVQTRTQTGRQPGAYRSSMRTRRDWHQDNGQLGKG